MFALAAGTVTKEKMMRRLLNLTPFLLLMAVAACETVQGAGRDLQDAGQTITQESRDVQSRM